MNDGDAIFLILRFFYLKIYEDMNDGDALSSYSNCFHMMRWMHELFALFQQKLPFSELSQYTLNYNYYLLHIEL